MKIQSSKLIRPVWANKEGTNNVFVFKACRYCPSTVWATRETRASSPFQPLPSSTFPSQGSFHDSEALGQGRGWRERQAWLPWALASLVAPHTWALRKPSIPAGPVQALLSSQRGPSCQGLSICSQQEQGSQGQHMSYQKASAWTPASDKLWKMQAVQSKKKGKGKQSSSISLKQACWFFDLEPRISTLSSCPFVLKWQIRPYIEVIPGQLIVWGTWCPTSQSPSKARTVRGDPTSPEASALCTGQGQC